MNKPKQGMDYFKGEVSARLDGVEKKVDEILNNHLPHLEAKIDKVHEKIDRFNWWLVGLLGAALASLFIQIINQ